MLVWNSSVSRYVATILKGHGTARLTYEHRLTCCFRQGESAAVCTHMGSRANCKRILVFDQNNSLLMHQRRAGEPGSSGS
jgi:hypothetical protein